MPIHSSALARAAAVLGGAALAAGMLAAAAAPASASALICGATITTSVTLTQNLDCSGYTAGNALNIGADNMTLNLGGYRIIGPGSSVRTAEGVVDSGYSGLTVENGTISNYYDDVDIEGTSGNYLTGIVVQNLRTTDSEFEYGYGIYGEYLDGARVRGNSVSDSYDAIELDHSRDSAVSHNQVADPEYGLYEDEGDGNTWSHNTLTGVTDYGVTADDSDDTAVRFNIVNGDSDAYGIYDEDSSGVTIWGNVVNNLYVGVYDEYGSDGTVSYNSGRGDEWGLYAYEADSSGYTANRLNFGEYGIELDYPTDAVLTSNVTSSNSDYGVDIYSGGEQTGYSATLNRNTANYNSYGLWSDFPASGHGNQATGNSVLNCHNVSCIGFGFGPEHSANSASARVGRTVSLPHRRPRALPAPARHVRH